MSVMFMERKLLSAITSIDIEDRKLTIIKFELYKLKLKNSNKYIINNNNKNNNNNNNSKIKKHKKQQQQQLKKAENTQVYT